MSAFVICFYFSTLKRKGTETGLSLCFVLTKLIGPLRPVEGNTEMAFCNSRQLLVSLRLQSRKLNFLEASLPV